MARLPVWARTSGGGAGGGCDVDVGVGDGVVGEETLGLATVAAPGAE